MSEPVIVPGHNGLQVPFINPDYSVSYHVIAAFQITGNVAKPVFWPAPQRGAIEVDEQPMRYSANGLTATTAGGLALLMREHSK